MRSLILAAVLLPIAPHADARQILPPKNIRATPVRNSVPASIEKGMMFDAIEHRLRIEKSLRAKRNLPTTIEHDKGELGPPMRKLLRDELRK